MKKIFILLFCVAFSLKSNAQNEPGQAWAYQQINTDEVVQADIDFKDYWCHFGDVLMHHDDDVTLGFIGKNYQRLRIRFTKVTKDSKNILVFNVAGKSLVKNNLVNFKGTITVQKVSVIKRGQKESYLAVVKYKLLEDKTKKFSGTFEGYGVINFTCTEAGGVYNTDEEGADGYSNNQFVGTWQQYGSTAAKVCNWGDYRIPESGDLDVGAGEFMPNYKYLKFGWQSYYNMIINLSSIDKKLENKKWWIY